MDKKTSFQFFLIHPNVVLLEWNETPSDWLLLELVTFRKLLLNKFETLIQVTQGYQSLMLYHSHPIKKRDVYHAELLSLFDSMPVDLSSKGKKWQIPVCYDPSLAPDLTSLAELLKLDTSEVIDRHAHATYTVYFIGFLPGFLYLSGLPSALECPRKKQPSPRVEAGSIAIGGKQTGIYPRESPGGWHIIGKTPYPLFRPEHKKPCFAQAGDSIVFKSISLEEYQDMTYQRANGNLIIEPQ